MVDILISILGIFLPLVCGGITILARWGHNSTEKRTENALKQAQQTADDASTKATNVEKTVNTLRITLPVEYVRKEDYKQDREQLHNTIGELNQKMDRILEILLKGGRANE